jgi:CBS domain containing-hemolysin-like protein
MQEILIVLIVFASIVYVIRSILDHRLRRRLIDSGHLDDKSKILVLQSDDRKQQYLNSIRWGLVLIGIGAALFLGNLFPGHITEEMTIGFIFFFSGLAFLVYYFLMKKEAADVETNSQ